MADNQTQTEEGYHFHRFVGDRICTRTQMRLPKRLVRAWGSDWPRVVILIDPASHRWEVPIMNERQKYAWLAERWGEILDAYCIKDGYLVWFAQKERAVFHFRSYVLYKEEISYPYVDCPTGFQVHPKRVDTDGMSKDVLHLLPPPLEKDRPVRIEPSSTAKEHNSDAPIKFSPSLQNLRPTSSKPSPAEKEHYFDILSHCCPISRNIRPSRLESSSLARKEDNSKVLPLITPPPLNVRLIMSEASPTIKEYNVPLPQPSLAAKEHNLDLSLQVPISLSNEKPIRLEPSPTMKEHNLHLSLQVPSSSNVKPTRPVPSPTIKKQTLHLPIQLPLPPLNVKPIRPKPSPLVKRYNFPLPQPSPAIRNHNFPLPQPLPTIRDHKFSLPEPSPVIRDQNFPLPLPSPAIRDHNFSLPEPSPVIRDQNFPLPLPSPAIRDHNFPLPQPSPAIRDQNFPLPQPSPAIRDYHFPLPQPPLAIRDHKFHLPQPSSVIKEHNFRLPPPSLNAKPIKPKPSLTMRKHNSDVAPLPSLNVRPIRLEGSPNIKVQNFHQLPLLPPPSLMNVRTTSPQPSLSIRDHTSRVPPQITLHSLNVQPTRKEPIPSTKEHNFDLPPQVALPFLNTRPIRSKPSLAINEHNSDVLSQISQHLLNVKPVGSESLPAMKEHNFFVPFHVPPPSLNVRPIEPKSSLAIKEHNSNVTPQISLIRLEPCPTRKEGNSDAPPKLLSPLQNLISTRPEPSSTARKHNTAYDAALSYQTNNPFFAITLKDYHCQLGMLNFPQLHAMTLKGGSKKQTWVMKSDHAPDCEVTCFRHKKSTAIKTIGKGWSEFREKANLVAGDALVVEVLDPNRRILHASIFRNCDYRTSE